MSARSTISETLPEREDPEIVVARPPFLQRLGFPAGVRPLRESLYVVLIVGPLLTVVYRLYDAHWKVPFSYSGDGISNAAYMKTIIDRGWYFHNPRLAAPFTSDWRDFPFGGENVHFISLKILGLITGNYALSVNFYFVFGFFAIALSGYFVCRYLAFSLPTSLVIGVVYAFLPYHAFRGESHETRGVYYMVPLAILVLIWLGQYRGALLRADGDAWRVRRGRIGFLIAVGFIVGMSDDQNAAFMVSIAAIIALIATLRDRDWRPLAIAGVLAVATFGSLFINNAPFVIARVERGKNPAVANRPLTDQDYYGLRPVDLILPAPGHRVKPLQTIATKAARGQVTNSETAGTPLGVIGAVGLVFSIGAALAFALGSRKPRKPTTEFAAQLGVMNLVAILLGTIGGLSFVLALAGFGLYRTWNRISVLIAFISLLATAVLLDRLFTWIRSRTKRRELGIGVVAVVTALLIVGGAFDQTSPRYVPNYKVVATRFDVDATFYHDLEKSVPKGSMIFQLPVVPFPEAGETVKMGDYQEFAGYLHTKDLKFSYGGIKGRPEGDWQQNLSIFDPAALLGQVAAAGFQGVVIDRTGVADGGAAFLKAAAPIVGTPILRSADDRLLYLDLSRLQARLQSELGADAVQQSSRLVLGDAVSWNGFSFPEPMCGGTRRWAMKPRASIDFVNKTNAPITNDFSTSFEANPASRSITVTGPGVNQTIPLTNGLADWKGQFVLPPGESKLLFSVDGPKVDAPGDARTLEFALTNYNLGKNFESPVVAWARGLQPACKPGN